MKMNGSEQYPIVPLVEGLSFDFGDLSHNPICMWLLNCLPFGIVFHRFLSFLVRTFCISQLVPFLVKEEVVLQR